MCYFGVRWPMLFWLLGFPATLERYLQKYHRPSIKLFIEVVLGVASALDGTVPNHMHHSSLGNGRPGNPIRPIRDYQWLLGLIGAY